MLRTLLLTPALIYGQSGSALSTSNLSATDTGPYTFTTTVTGHSLQAPSGSVKFTDQTASRTFGSAPLGAATTTQSFGTQTAYPVGNAPMFVAMGDFNGDGHPDLVVANQNDFAVSVLLGNGDGTFQPPSHYPVGSAPQSVAVGDFNGDGHLDLVVANFGDDTVSVLLGNGDGTFQPQTTDTATTSGPQGLAVGDFNGDGYLDLVTANGYYDNGSIDVLLGNGDGTFKNFTVYPAGHQPETIAVSDVNGDGRPDLIVTNGSFVGGGVSVLLGSGNGTFQPPITYEMDGWIHSVAVSDVNGDGHPDIVVAGNGNAIVSVLLGNGNGTFQPRVPYTVGSQPESVAVSDVNGDGHPDLIVANFDDNNVSLLLNKGDGTFQPQVSYAAGNGPLIVAAGDLNGDGVPDLAVATFLSNTVSVVLNNLTHTTTATLPNTAVIGSGSHTIQASYNGDSTYAASSGATSVTASLVHSTLTLAASASVTAGQSTQLVASLSPATQSGVTATGIVTFTNTGNGATLGTAPLSNGTATLATSFATTGNVTIQATYNGDTNFAAATSNPVAATVTPAPSFTITPFPSIEYAVKRGTLGGFLLQLQSVNGFVGGVKLSCAGGPAGSYCANLPQTVTLNGTAWAGSGLYVPPKTQPGTYKVNFTGTSGSINVTATANFVVSK